VRIRQDEHDNQDVFFFFRRKPKITIDVSTKMFLPPHNLRRSRNIAASERSPLPEADLGFSASSGSGENEKESETSCKSCQGLFHFCIP
jgi:hypothetical protein